MHGCLGCYSLNPGIKKFDDSLPGSMLTKRKNSWTTISVFGLMASKLYGAAKVSNPKKKCMVPTVKHGGGIVLMWGCLSVAGVEDGYVNSQMYCSILKEKIQSLRALG